MSGNKLELQTMPLRFRVWDKAFGTMRDNLTLPELVNFLSQTWQINGNYPDYEFSQDTNLKDKSGKSIYTGDIIKFDEIIAVTEYDYGVIKFYRVNEQYYFAAEPRNVEIIGNIWQNQELLETE